MIFRDNLIPIVWNSILPIKATKNLEKSKPDFMNNLLKRERALRDTQLRSIHGMEELTRVEEMRLFAFSRHDLAEIHSTMLELT